MDHRRSHIHAPFHRITCDRAGDSSPVARRVQAFNRGESNSGSESGSTGPQLRAGDSRTRVVSGGTMYSGIKQVLRGWLPGRAAPKDLVRRGILHADPSGSKQGTSAHAIYGNALPVVLRRADTDRGVPRVVRVLMGRLRANDYEGLRTEGVFRVPGDSSEMRAMREQINQGEDVEAVFSRCDNLHSVAGMLKMFFREMPSPLLSFELYDDFIRCSSQLSGGAGEADLTEVLGLLARLPEGCKPTTPNITRSTHAGGMPHNVRSCISLQARGTLADSHAVLG